MTAGAGRADGTFGSAVSGCEREAGECHFERPLERLPVIGHCTARNREDRRRTQHGKLHLPNCVAIRYAPRVGMHHGSTASELSLAVRQQLKAGQSRQLPTLLGKILLERYTWLNQFPIDLNVRRERRPRRPDDDHGGVVLPSSRPAKLESITLQLSHELLPTRHA